MGDGNSFVAALDRIYADNDLRTKLLGERSRARKEALLTAAGITIQRDDAVKMLALVRRVLDSGLVLDRESVDRDEAPTPNGGGGNGDDITWIG
jgi:hypothetical protein